MKPNIDDMLVFAEVVDARSFTGAAKKLGKTTSAVSQTVTRLEADMGLRLLHRSTRALSLTDSGARFYAAACDIRTSFEEALASAEEKRTDPTGRLYITAPHALSNTLVMPAVAAYMALYPDMEVRILIDDSPADLLEAQIDLAIRVGQPDGQTARISRLGSVTEGLYASPRLFGDSGDRGDSGNPPPPLDAQHIAALPHLANEWQGSPVRYKAPDGSQIRVTPRVRSNNLMDLLTLAAQGVGAARLPDSAATPYRDRGQLLRLFSIAETPVFAVHLYPGSAPKKVTAFVSSLKDQFLKASGAANQASG